MPINGWYPRLSADGRIVSGFGQVWFGGEIILNPGFRPQWLDQATIVAIGEGDRLFAVNLDGSGVQTLHANPLSAFAAGAGRHRVVDPRAGEIWCAIDPVTGAEGIIVEHGGSNNDRSLFVSGRAVIEHCPINEARMFGGMVVWRHWTGRSAHDSGIRGVRDYIGRSAVENLRSLEHDWEGQPVPIMTDEGPWFSFMTNVDIRLRPWNSTEGYIIVTGEDRNFNHDSLGMGRTIRVAWNDNRGGLETRDVDLRQPRTDVRRPLTPITRREPDVEVPMSVPNRAAELAAFHQSWNGGQRINDEAEKHRFTEALMAHFNQLDRSGRWGRKSRAGSGQPKSKDTGAYWVDANVPNGESDGRIHAFDLITGSTGDVHWDTAAENGDPLYANIHARWYPVTGTTVPPPQRPENTHKYIGGGNDTGTCDVCNRSRMDPVHLVNPNPHAYDGGEHDTGQCDICQKRKDDPIHQQAPPSERHMFEGSGRFCSACGKPSDDAVHRQDPPEDQAVGDLLRQILDSSRRLEQKVDQLIANMRQR